jgi:hypothetical protein
LKRADRRQRADRCYQLQRSSYCSLSVILMGVRITEVDQNAIAQIFGHETAKPAHGFGDALLVGGNNLAQVLGVHSSRECGRTN